MNTLFSRVFGMASLAIISGSTLLAGTLGTSFEPTTEVSKQSPWTVKGSYEKIAKAKVHKRNHSMHRELGFQKSIFLLDDTSFCHENAGISYGAGYVQYGFDWNHKKMFREKEFRNLVLNMGGFRMAGDGWRWDANIALQINTEHFSLSRYTLFRGYVQGKYDWTEKSNLYAGFMAVTGMRSTFVLPIIGFDYTQSERLKYNVIFPYNVSAIYALTDCWSVDAAVRTFYSSQRLNKKDQPNHMRRGLVKYGSIGAEVGLNYYLANSLLAGVYVGENMSGRLRLSRHNDKHRRHYTLGSAAYAGASITYAF